MFNHPAGRAFRVQPHCGEGMDGGVLYRVQGRADQEQSVAAERDGRHVGLGGQLAPATERELVQHLDR